MASNCSFFNENESEVIQEVTRILVFGSSSSGKTSMINLLTDSQNQVGDGGLRGCTFESKDINFKRNNKLYTITDTVGLDEASGGTVIASDALIKLIELIKKAKDGFNLVIFVRKAGVLKKEDENNYNLIFKELLNKQVKTICVNTHAEIVSKDLASLNQWWLDNQNQFEERDMIFDGGVSGCCAQITQPSTNDYLKQLITNYDYSGTMRSLIWDAIDKYKSEKPIYLNDDYYVTFRRVWNIFFAFVPLIDFRFKKKQIENCLIGAHFSKEVACTVALMLAEGQYEKLSKEIKREAIKILVFGLAKSGKTGMVNLLTGNNSRTDDKFESKDVTVVRNSKLYIFTDTIGINEATSDADAEIANRNLRELIKTKGKDGFNLAIYVRRAVDLEKQDEINYNLIIRNLLKRKVSTLCVNTLSYLETYSLNQWWLDNQNHFRERGMIFNDGVSGCCVRSVQNPLINETLVHYRTITYSDIWKAIDNCGKISSSGCITN